MKSLLTISIVLLGISISIAQVPFNGIWTDNSKKNTYSFLRNNEFQFQVEGFGQGQHIIGEGVWEYQPGICWLGDKKSSIGNLMIYADTIQCCMQAQIFGSRLVLSDIWKKGPDIHLQRACQNRVLTKHQ